jgi:hypothetical protein
VHVTVSVWLEPKVTLPNDTGLEQLSGRLTGAPRQYRTPLLSVV